MSLGPIDGARLTVDAGAVLVSIGTATVFWYRRRGARHWPVTDGTVEYGLSSDVDGWRTNLVYSYSVNGDFYSGTHAVKAANEADADEQARNWKGQSLTVRYSPRNPAISVIRMEEQAPFVGKMCPKPWLEYRVTPPGTPPW